MGELDGKAIVITGAGRGIGAACALSAAARGGLIVVNDVDAVVADATVAAITGSGGHAVAHAADITNARQAQELIDHCVDVFGRIDGLVNNAGIAPRGNLVDLDEAVLRRTFDINVMGTAFCGAAAARHMVGQRSGSIVNINSGAQCGTASLSIYAASKGAVASFTYAWAVELKGTGVRVNGFAPIATATRQVADYMNSGGGPGVTIEPVEPSLNAPPVDFLLSDDSAEINGQILRFDGKRITLMAHPAIVIPWVETPAGDFASIVNAFHGTLSQRQMPLGIAEVKIEF